MGPVKPHWVQPSHPNKLKLIINEAEYSSKSISLVTLPPFAVFVKLDFPPCTNAEEATYATVQTGRSSHLNLNSDLLYINHSCEPSLIFDTSNMNVLAGPKGLMAGDELTFFYPSTEWHMAQPFDCQCGKSSCRGKISGARDMTVTQLEGVWLNNHIHELLDDRSQGFIFANDSNVSDHAADPTVQTLQAALNQAEKVVKATRLALYTYTGAKGNSSQRDLQHNRHAIDLSNADELKRRGLTSRELSGEMGGDTATVIRAKGGKV